MGAVTTATILMFLLMVTNSQQTKTVTSIRNNNGASWIYPHRYKIKVGIIAKQKIWEFIPATQANLQLIRYQCDGKIRYLTVMENGRVRLTDEYHFNSDPRRRRWELKKLSSGETCIKNDFTGSYLEIIKRHSLSHVHLTTELEDAAKLLLEEETVNPTYNECIWRNFGVN